MINYIISLKNNLKLRIEELKISKYIISKTELKNIKKNLCNIEKQRKTSLKKTSKYLDELDKRILSLDKYNDDDDYEM